MLAAVGLELGMEAEVDEGIEVGAGHHVDRAAVAAVAAVGPAARDELLAPEAHGAASAVARRDLDVYFVNEHGGVVVPGVPRQRRWAVHGRVGGSEPRGDHDAERDEPGGSRTAPTRVSADSRGRRR